MEQIPKSDIKVGKGKHPNSRKNLKSYKPGERRPDQGHPKGQRNFNTLFNIALRKIGEKNGKEATEIEEELVESGLIRARNDFRFYKDTLDRVHGPYTNEKSVIVNINMENKEKIKTIADKVIEKMKEEENI